MEPANEKNRWLPAVIFIAALGVLLGLSLWGADVVPPAGGGEKKVAEVGAGEVVEAAFSKGEEGAAARELIAAQPDGTWPLRVEVVDAHGDPVAGARVTVVDPVQGESIANAITDAHGSCEVFVAADRAAVRAIHEEVGRTLTLPVSQAEDEEVPVRLVLWRPVEMRGVVLGEDAQPLRGMQVRIEASNLLYGTNAPHVSPERVVSDRLGRFTFEAPVGLQGFATMRVPGVKGRVEAKWTAKLGGQVVLAVPGAFKIEGLVLDEQGNRTKANVSLANVLLGSWSTKEEPRERFSLDVDRPGQHAIVALGFDGFTAQQTVELSVARPRAYVELTLTKAKDSLELAPVKKVVDPDATITVDVFRNDGSPAAGVELLIAGSHKTGFSNRAFTSNSNRVKVGGRVLWERPLDMLINDATVDQWAVLHLPQGPVPPHVRVSLEPTGGVDFVALCRGRDARGVNLYLTTPHTDFASGTGKHRMQIDEVPPGPAVLEARRGFELLATKKLIIRGGITNYATIEVDL